MLESHMATLATFKEQNEIRPESGDPCRVVTFYDDQLTRARLMRFCDSLIKELGEEIEFEFSWWKYRFLTDAIIASLCAEAATQADLLVFSTYAGNEPPPQLRAVNEIWLNRRFDQEGLLLVLLDAVNAPSDLESPALQYFQDIAQRGQLEFVTHWFPHMPGSAEVSMDYFTCRANQVTPVLKEILDRSQGYNHEARE
jgi:hypothetical protein